jgi:hypothetical protein
VREHTAASAASAASAVSAVSAVSAASGVRLTCSMLINVYLFFRHALAHWNSEASGWAH